MKTVNELIAMLESLPQEVRKLPVVYTDESTGVPWSAEINLVAPWKPPGRRSKELTCVVLKTR
jgi:hypothetical protein